MTLLVKKNRNLFPSRIRDFFGPNGFFDSDIIDLNNDLLDFDVTSAIPSVNVVESDRDFRLELAAPGLERKDFKIEADDHMLTISAEKKEEKKEKNERYSRREYSYNSFSRSFQLPENTIADKVEAKYENGVLNVSIPKKEVTVSKPKKEIQVN